MKINIRTPFANLFCKKAECPLIGWPAVTGNLAFNLASSNFSMSFDESYRKYIN